MSIPFDATRGPIILEAEISGPIGRANIRLLFDTGATMSVIAPARLISAGYDRDGEADRYRVTTGNGSISAPRLVLTRLTALGQHRFGFPVLAHPLPPEANVDGLLGLDFLRGLAVTLDFRAGSITVA